MISRGGSLSWPPSVEQLSQPYAERFSEPLDNGDGGVADPACDIADVGAVDAGFVGECLLAPAFLLAKAAQGSAEARAYLHGRSETRLSPIDLQTMRDIDIDFTGVPSTSSVTDRRRMVMPQALLSPIAPADSRYIKLGVFRRASGAHLTR